MRDIKIITDELLSLMAEFFEWVISECSPEKPPPSGVYDLREYDVVGDGATNDTAAIQSAIDAASAAGGGTVIGHKRDTYLIYFTGEQPGYPGATPYRYCLRVPSNVTLDLQGGALKLADAQNASLIMNANTEDGNTDVNISILSMVLDNNRTKQTESFNGSQAALYFYGVGNLRVVGIKVKDAYIYAGRFQNVYNSFFDKLTCKGSSGTCWNFGHSSVRGVPFDLRDSIIGDVSAEGGEGRFTRFAAGSPFVGAFKRVKINSITSRNCAAGVKIQGGSEDVTIDSVVTHGGANSTDNSGMKIQGDSAQTPEQAPKRITVNSVVSEGHGGAGLYIQDAMDVHVLSYTGRNNSGRGKQIASYPDVWLHGTNITIDDIKSSGAGSNGITIRQGAVNYKLGDVHVLNPGAVPGSRSHAIGVSISGGNGTIGNILVEDDRDPPILTRGVNAHDASAVADIETLRVLNWSVCDICSVSSDVVVHTNNSGPKV